MDQEVPFQVVQGEARSDLMEAEAWLPQRVNVHPHTLVPAFTRDLLCESPDLQAFPVTLGHLVIDCLRRVILAGSTVITHSADTQIDRPAVTFCVSVDYILL